MSDIDMNPGAAQPVPTSENPAPRPWGPWASAAIVILLVWPFLFLAPIAGAGVLARMGLVHPTLIDFMLFGDEPDGSAYMEGLMLGGAGALAGLVVILLFVRVRRGLSMKEYLALHPIPVRTLIRWSAAVASLKGAGILLSLYLAARFGEAFGEIAREIPAIAFSETISGRRGAQILWILMLVCVAPIQEEIIYRGFLFRGFQNSKLGDWGAVIGTAIIFTVIHDTYFLPFVLGLMFGLARLRTKSLYAPLTMHILANLIAVSSHPFFLSLTDK